MDFEREREAARVKLDTQLQCVGCFGLPASANQLLQAFCRWWKLHQPHRELLEL